MHTVEVGPDKPLLMVKQPEVSTLVHTNADALPVLNPAWPHGNSKSSCSSWNMWSVLQAAHSRLRGAAINKQKLHAWLCVRGPAFCNFRSCFCAAPRAGLHRLFLARCQI